MFDQDDPFPLFAWWSEASKLGESLHEHAVLIARVGLSGVGGVVVVGAMLKASP